MEPARFFIKKTVRFYPPAESQKIKTNGYALLLEP